MPLMAAIQPQIAGSMGTFSRLQWDSFHLRLSRFIHDSTEHFRHMEVIEGDFLHRVGQMDAGSADIRLIHIH